MNVIEIFNEDKFLNINTSVSHTVRDLTGTLLEERQSVVVCICGELNVGVLNTEEIVMLDNNDRISVSYTTLENTPTTIGRYASDDLDIEAYRELNISLDDSVGYSCITTVVNILREYNQLGEMTEDVSQIIYILR